MTAKVTRWRDEVERIVVEVLEDQPHFSEVTWDFTIDFRMIGPTQPPVAVGHVLIMVPSMILDSPPLVSECSLPLLGAPPEDPFKESLRGFLRQIVEARQKQFVQSQAAQPTLNDVRPPNDRYTINGTPS